MTQKKKTILAVVLVVIAIIVCYMSIRWRQNQRFYYIDWDDYKIYISARCKELNMDEFRQDETDQADDTRSMWLFDDENGFSLKKYKTGLDFNAEIQYSLKNLEKKDKFSDCTIEWVDESDSNKKTALLKGNTKNNKILYSYIIWGQYESLHLGGIFESDKAEKYLEELTIVKNSVQCEPVDMDKKRIYYDNIFHIEVPENYIVEKNKEGIIEIMETNVEDYRKYKYYMYISENNSDTDLKKMAEDIAEKYGTTVEEVVLPNGINAYATRKYSSEELSLEFRKNYDVYFFELNNKKYRIVICYSQGDEEVKQKLWNLIEKVEVK